MAGSYKNQPQMRIKLLQQLMDMGFKVGRHIGTFETFASGLGCSKPHSHYLGDKSNVGDHENL
jgi:hypothetical protein